MTHRVANIPHNTSVSPTERGQAKLAPSQSPETIAVTVQTPAQPPDYAGMALNGGIGLVGGVLGAVIGAWAAYKFGLKASREANEKAELAQDRHLRFAVTQKLGKIYSAQREIRTNCEQAAARLAMGREEAAREGANFLDHFCMELRPFATSVARLSFTPEEVAQFRKCGDHNVLKNMMVLDDRHNTTADLLDEFRGLRAEFEAISHRGGEFDADRGYMQFRWSQEDYDRYRPQLFKMDGVAKAIHEHSTQDEKDAYEGLLAIAKSTAKFDGPKVDIRITMPDGRVARVTPAGVEYFEAEAVPPLAEAALPNERPG